MTVCFHWQKVCTLKQRLWMKEGTLYVGIHMQVQYICIHKFTVEMGLVIQCFPRIKKKGGGGGFGQLSVHF